MLVSESKFEDSKFYVEFVTFDSEEEKEEAEVYLKSWVKFLLKKMTDYEMIGTPEFIESERGNNMGVKIQFKLKTS